MAYSAQLQARFMQTRFGGEATALTGQRLVKAYVGDYAQGSVLEFSVVIKQDYIHSARFKCYGCAACIALADLVCEKLESLPLAEVKQLAVQELATELELPMSKMHCVWLVTDALNQLGKLQRTS